MIVFQKNKWIIVFILSLIAFVVRGQSYVQLEDSKDAKFVNYRIDPAESSVDGSPYYGEDWMAGVITFWKHTMEFDSIHFNLFKQEILFRQSGRTLAIPPEVKVVSFTIGDAEFLSFDENSSFKDEYLKVLLKGDSIQLLKRYECKIIEGKASNGIVKEVPDRYRIFEDNYIYTTTNNKFYKVSRKMNFEEIFLKYEKEILTYIKREKLKLRKDEDLIYLIKYINHLYTRK